VAIERLLLLFPTKDEGYLTKQKNYLVSSKNLSFISNKLNLISHITSNKSLIIKSDSVKKRISCDIYEAIIGAIYLDSDYKHAQTFIKDTLFKYYDINKAQSSNYKGILNEFCQKKGLSEPNYKIIEINGLEHQKVYKVELFINDSLFVGNATKLRRSEEKAAKKALINFNLI
jgi:ribonuclease-3